MNRLYIPQPTAWPSDPIGTQALKVMCFCLFMLGVYGAVQLLEIMVR
ncbi:hypothetical protein IED13_00905 [Bosea sp. SSUT16]|uniref:Uncharacterized protein n=1 Tax=Bosea spartocytisi TaxID=2773451 RepID=A0A927E515_9HYPH|nr:hypothetical protein [Bosea spartocytisi]